jgi:hypothetical protein
MRPFAHALKCWMDACAEVLDGCMRPHAPRREVARFVSEHHLPSVVVRYAIDVCGVGDRYVLFTSTGFAKKGRGSWASHSRLLSMLEVLGLPVVTVAGEVPAAGATLATLLGYKSDVVANTIVHASQHAHAQVKQRLLKKARLEKARQEEARREDARLQEHQKSGASCGSSGRGLVDGTARVREGRREEHARPTMPGVGRAPSGAGSSPDDHNRRAARGGVHAQCSGQVCALVGGLVRISALTFFYMHTHSPTLLHVYTPPCQDVAADARGAVEASSPSPCTRPSRGVQPTPRLAKNLEAQADKLLSHFACGGVLISGHRAGTTVSSVTVPPGLSVSALTALLGDCVFARGLRSETTLSLPLSSTALSSLGELTGIERAALRTKAIPGVMVFDVCALHSRPCTCAAQAMSQHMDALRSTTSDTSPGM